ncbi:MAG: thiazole synthase [Nitrospinota bacterium]
MNDRLVIAGRKFKSRLLVGTGKFGSSKLMRDAIEASGAEIVTVSIRRVDINNPDDNILSFVDQEKYLLLSNTAGARTADEAVLLAKLAYEAGMPNWIKIEVTPEPRYLLPDPIETLKATEILVKDGFVVLPYINADPLLAKKLEDVGAAAVMPLGSPIGANKGIRNVDMIKIIIEQALIPVVVDAGLGAPSHASLALELGADACLVNTAIAVAKDPVRMASAFQLGCQGGRSSFLAGLPKPIDQASTTSPFTRLPWDETI